MALIMFPFSRGTTTNGFDFVPTFARGTTTNGCESVPTRQGRHDKWLRLCFHSPEEPRKMAVIMFPLTRGATTNGCSYVFYWPGEPRQMAVIMFPLARGAMTNDRASVHTRHGDHDKWFNTKKCNNVKQKIYGLCLNIIFNQM